MTGVDNVAEEQILACQDCGSTNVGGANLIPCNGPACKNKAAGNHYEDVVGWFNIDYRVDDDSSVGSELFCSMACLVAWGAANPEWFKEDDAGRD